MVDQYLRRQNYYIGQAPLESTPLGMNKNNGTTSPSYSIPIRKQLTKPTPLTIPTDSPSLPTDFPEQDEKTNIPGVTDPDSSLSDSSSKKSNLSNDTNSSKSKKNKRDRKKKNQKDKKDYTSDSSSSNYGSFYDSDYRHKQSKRKSNWEKDPIKLSARLTEKLLTTAYQSKIIKFKLDLDLPQRRIFFSHL